MNATEIKHGAKDHAVCPQGWRRPDIHDKSYTQQALRQIYEQRSPAESMFSVPENNIANAASGWSRLAIIWSIYYFVLWTFARNPQYTQKIVWIGAGIVGVLTVPLFLRQIGYRHIPREVIVFGSFWLWGMTGLFVATDIQVFVRYIRLGTQFTLIMLFVSIIIKYSGASKWFYFAFLAVSVARVFMWNEPISINTLSPDQVDQRRIDSANEMGLACALGILAMLALMVETKSIIVKVLYVIGGIIALYGLVLSASRGAFGALMTIMVLWPVFCMMDGRQVTIRHLLGAVAVSVLSYYIIQYITHSTYMGVRVMSAAHMEDKSSQIRLDLFLISFRIFMQYPITGCGLGQYGIASGTGYYAHNEFAELLGTTGLPGVILYYSVYLFAWRRLTRSLQNLRDPITRYRINIARIVLLVLLATGATSNPNFLGNATMFLLSIAVGTANWADRAARSVCNGPTRSPIDLVGSHIPWP